MKNCMGILHTALNIKPSPAFTQARPADIALHLRLIGSEIGERRNIPPKRPDQNVYRCLRSSEKSTALSLWNPPAIVNASVTVRSLGSLVRRMTNAATMPARMTVN